MSNKRKAAAPAAVRTVPQDVMVAWVHSEQVAHSWFVSIMGAILGSPRIGPYTAMKCGTDGLVAARNDTVKAFLRSQADWLWWIDTDMGFAPDALEQLMAVADPVERPVVGALCFSNRETGQDGMNGFRCDPVPTLYRFITMDNGMNGFQPIFDYERDSLVEVAGTGSACIVIHRSVFEKIQADQGGAPNWYIRLTNPTTGQLIGEDLSFCYRAAQAGFRLFVDTSVKTTHLKPIWLQERDYDEDRVREHLGIPREEVA